MRSLLLVVIVCTAYAGTGGTEAQPASDDDHDLLATLVQGVQAHEFDVPPLTLCGVWRGFYTPLHWAVFRQVFELTNSPLEDFERMDKGDRAAVAICLWESAEGEEWQMEYQGAYRGPNPWVQGQPRPDPRECSDLYRRDMGWPDRTLVLDAHTGYPVVEAEPPSECLPHLGNAAVYVGLSGFGGRLADLLSAPLAEDGWRLAPIEQDGDVVTVHMGNWHEGTQDAVERTFEVDAVWFRVLRQRHVAVVGGKRGAAVEYRWSRYEPIPDSDIWLPRSMTQWEFHYGLPDVGTLRKTTTFTCLGIEATPPDSSRPLLPLGARWEQNREHPELTDPTEFGYGLSILRNVGGFATEEPPAPPQDLLNLDLEAFTAQVKERYGFK